MNEILNYISKNICYTELVYQRINKKLNTDLNRKEIELFVMKVLLDKNSVITKKGKNYYIENKEQYVVLTINSFTNRLITVNRR